MIRTLNKLGNSWGLIITKEMREHLGLDANEIDVQLERGKIVLSKPREKGGAGLEVGK